MARSSLFRARGTFRVMLLALAVSLALLHDGWLQSAVDGAESPASAAGGQPVDHGSPAHPAKVAPEVSEALASASSVPVIVTLSSAAPPPSAGPRPLDLAALIDSVAASGARVVAATPSTEFGLVHQYKAVPALAGTATAAGVRALAAHPDVLHIALNREIRADLAEAVPLINADDAHNRGRTGAGVVAAVLDTGIDTDHPLLSDDLVHQACFLTDGTCPGGGTTGLSAEDGHGHGSHVSGIITSNGPPVGVAPDASIEAFKVLNDSGSGSFDNVLAAYDHIIVSRPEVDIINMSLGDRGSYSPGSCEGFIPALTTAIDTTREMGITTFAAAGNNGSKAGIGYPACIDDIVSVGAVYDADVGPKSWSACADSTTAADQVTCFSQSNISLDLLAPGSTIDSTVPGGGLDNFSGTSMASPMAAGVAALVLQGELQGEPSLPAVVETRLTETGVPVTDAGNGVTTCRVDAYEAVVNDGGSVCAPSGPPPPANDNFADGVVIPEPLSYSNAQLTTGATTETGEPSPCGAIASTVWYQYRFTPTVDTALQADSLGSDYDTVVAVYTGASLATLTNVGCDDDFFGVGQASRVQFTALAGVTYHIQAGGFNGSTGNLVLNLAEATAPDLIELSVSNPPSSKNRGSSFNITDTAKNQGTASSGSTVTRYYLSADAARDPGDKLLSGSRAVPGLAPGATSTGTARVRIPTDTARASYYLLACADDTRVAVEIDETNNCIASSGRIQLK